MASEEAEKQFNKSAQPHAFLPDQLVLLDKHSFLAKNQKLAPKWSGPHKILRLKGDCNVEILLRHNNKKLITHVNRLKPYFVQSPSAISSPDFFPAQKAATPPPVQQQNKAQLKNFYPYENEILEEVIHTDPSPSTRATQALLRRRTTSSSSSVYDNQEVNLLTLPLLINSHMLMLLIALVNAYLLLHHAHLSPRTAWPRGRARAQAPSPSSVQNFTCHKSPLTRFQF